MRIKKILHEAPAVRGRGHRGTESEEDVGSHSIDPAHEGYKCVQDKVAQTNTEAVVVEIVFIENI